MASNISRENEQFIDAEVAKGTFRDRTEALDAGVGLLRQQQRLAERLHNSRQQLDDGQCVELDSTGLRQLFEDLKEQAREHATGTNDQ